MKNLKNRVFSLIFILFLMITINGCATNTIIKMPLNKDISELNFDNKGIAILSLTISNIFKVKFQPEVWSLGIVEITDLGEINYQRFTTEEVYESVKEQYNKYLISFKLSPGKYKLTGINGGAKYFLIFGSFNFPINFEFELNTNKITYIGSIEMINRKKKDGEPSSGPDFPIVDQVVSGFANGTFDIKVSDNYNYDIKAFNEKYPYIINSDVVKNIIKINGSD